MKAEHQFKLSSNAAQTSPHTSPSLLITSANETGPSANNPLERNSRQSNQSPHTSSRKPPLPPSANSVKKMSVVNATPRTPRHPSNGYRVYLDNDDTNDTASDTSPSMSSLLPSLQASPSFVAAESSNYSRAKLDAALTSNDNEYAPFWDGDDSSSKGLSSIDPNVVHSTNRRRSMRLQARLSDSTPTRIWSNFGSAEKLPHSYGASESNPSYSNKKMKDAPHVKNNAYGGEHSKIDSLECIDLKHDKFASPSKENCLSINSCPSSSARRRSLRLQLKSVDQSPLDATKLLDGESNAGSLEHCESTTGGSEPGFSIVKTKSNRTRRRLTAHYGSIHDNEKSINGEDDNCSDLRMAQLPPLPPSKKRRIGVSVRKKKNKISSDFTLKSAKVAIGMTKNGHMKLVEALEQIALDVLCSNGTESLYFDAMKSSSTTKDSLADIDIEINALVPQKSKVVSNMKVSPEISLCINNGEHNSSDDYASSDEDWEGKENATRFDQSNRRDTFDLSRRRRILNAKQEEGSTRPKNLSNTDVISEYAFATSMSSKTKSSEKDELRKKLFESSALPVVATSEHMHEDTPLDAILSEISRALDDEPSVEGDTAVSGCIAMSSPETTRDLKNLSSIEIEDEMRRLFSQFKVYNYPCVSARIFSAMSILMLRDHFGPVLPLLSSLVKAEIVSLQNKEEYRDVYFINKKVCFSGFDYSSTMPTSDRISDSHVDLCTNIKALEQVLKEAQMLPRDSLDAAIKVLELMNVHHKASEECAKTILGFFPSSRFERAIKHYLHELNDIKSYLLTQNSSLNDHVGVRYRLGDFIGRSIRFHLRKLFNSIPEDVVTFDVSNCEERWGRAVDDRSISSIFNYALEILSSNNDFFEDGDARTFFARKASANVLSVSKQELNKICRADLEEVLMDIKEARSFLFGARACEFVCDLIQCPGVDDHIRSLGGWDSIESLASIFYDLQLHECMENGHFVLLKNFHDLTAMLSHKMSCKEFIEHKVLCEEFIRRLRKRLNPRKRESSFAIRGSPVHAIKMCLNNEMEEHFPLVRHESEQD